MENPKGGSRYREEIDKYSLGKSRHRRIRREDAEKKGLLLEREFHFGLVENGTAAATEGVRTRTVRRGDVLMLTPSRSCRIHDMSGDFEMVCIDIQPDFFDTLPDAQPMYGQLIKRSRAFSPPVIHPEAEACEQLRKTASLFADATEIFDNYREGIIRHLSSLFLLQLANALHHDNREIPISVKRIDSLFREFGKLAVLHFRTHHDIAFYADRLCISPTYLSRIVRQTTGHTVHTHLAELLSAEARKDLVSTDLAVKEIADRLGFSDQSSFGKFFKSQTGLSPHHYRQRFGRSE